MVKRSLALFLIAFFASKLYSQSQLIAKQLDYIKGGNVSDLVQFNNSTYAATDGGIFVLDAGSTSWRIFNNGFASDSGKVNVNFRKLLVWDNSLLALNQAGRLFMHRPNTGWELILPEYKIKDMAEFQGKLFFFGCEKGWEQFLPNYQLMSVASVAEIPKTYGYYTDSDFWYNSENLSIVGDKLILNTSNRTVIYDGNQFKQLSRLADATQIIGTDSNNIFGIVFSFFGPNTYFQTNNLFKLIDNNWVPFNIDSVQKTYATAGFICDNNLMFHTYQQTAATITSKLYTQIRLPLAGEQWMESVTTGEINAPYVRGLVKTDNTNYVAFNNQGFLTTSSPFIIPSGSFNEGLHATSHSKSVFNNEMLLSMTNGYGLMAWDGNGNDSTSALPPKLRPMDLVECNGVATIIQGSYDQSQVLFCKENLGTWDTLPIPAEFDADRFLKSGTSGCLVESYVDWEQEKIDYLIADVKAESYRPINLPPSMQLIIDAELVGDKIGLVGYNLNFESGDGWATYYLDTTIMAISYNGGNSFKEIDFAYRKDYTYTEFSKNARYISRVNDSLFFSYFQHKWNLSTSSYDTKYTYEYFDNQSEKLISLGAPNKYVADFEVHNNVKIGFEAYYYNPQLCRSEGGIQDWQPVKIVGLPEGSVISQIFYDKQDNMFVGTQGNGIFSIDMSTGLDENNLKAELIKVYPNPAKNNLYIPLLEKKQQKVYIFDITGKEVYSSQIDPVDDRINIDIQHFQAGIFAGKVIGESGTKTFLFIKN